MNVLGKKGEELVSKHYQKLGYKILDSNYIFPRGKQIGEIDLVCQKNREIVFVEVKTRTSTRFGTPFEAVDRNKQRKLIKTCKLYLQIHPQYHDFDCRIDVAAVDIDPVRGGASNGVDNKQDPVIILTNAIEDLD